MQLQRPFATVTSSLDGDVLAVLAHDTGRLTTGQLHRILNRHSEEGIRKVLRRLTAQGIVDSDRVGNAYTYRLNREHLAAEYIVGLAYLPETLLERLAKLLASWQRPPIYAAIFGSAARGSMTAGSDLDLLLIRNDDVADDIWGEQVRDLSHRVTRWTGNDTRPLEFAVSELAAHGGEHDVLREVLRDGLVVAGTRAWLAKKLRAKESVDAHQELR